MFSNLIIVRWNSIKAGQVYIIATFIVFTSNYLLTHFLSTSNTFPSAGQRFYWWHWSPVVRYRTSTINLYKLWPQNAIKYSWLRLHFDEINQMYLIKTNSNTCYDLSGYFIQLQHGWTANWSRPSIAKREVLIIGLWNPRIFE